MVFCVIQGDFRKGTQLAIEEMIKKVDIVIFSTWVVVGAGSIISKDVKAGETIYGKQF